MENETKQAYNILSQALFANNIDRDEEFFSSERDIFGGFRKALLTKLENCFDIQMLDAQPNKINVRNFFEKKFLHILFSSFIHFRQYPIVFSTFYNYNKIITFKVHKTVSLFSLKLIF